MPSHRRLSDRRKGQGGYSKAGEQECLSGESYHELMMLALEFVGSSLRLTTPRITHSRLFGTRH